MKFFIFQAMANMAKFLFYFIHLGGYIFVLLWNFKFLDKSRTNNTKVTFSLLVNIQGVMRHFAFSILLTLHSFYIFFLQPIINKNSTKKKKRRVENP